MSRPTARHRDRADQEENEVAHGVLSKVDCDSSLPPEPGRKGPISTCGVSAEGLRALKRIAVR